MQTATITFKKTLLPASSWYFMTIAPSHFHGPGRTRLTRDDNDPATYDDKEVMWNRLRLCPCTWKRPSVNASKQLELTLGALHVCFYFLACTRVPIENVQQIVFEFSMEMSVFECLKSSFENIYVCLYVRSSSVYTTDPIWRKFTPNKYFKSTYRNGNDELYSTSLIIRFFFCSNISKIRF